MLLNITAIPGDGVGPEVTDEAIRVLETVAEVFSHQLIVTRKPIGGAALLSDNDPLPADTLQACLAAGAVLLGAVGGPAFDSFPSHLRPERGSCACGANWACLPISGRRFALLRSKTLPHCGRKSCAAQTS